MLRLIAADIRRHAFAGAAVVLIIALATALGVAVSLSERALRLGSARAAEAFDLVIGAPGSETQLVLSAVFLQPAPLTLIPGSVLPKLLGDGRVAWAAPVGFGDFVEMFPIVGTTDALVIRERLSDANRWRDHVMVVAHRSGGLAGAKMLHPENFLASAGSAMQAGAEIVEVDIQKSRDGEYVVFHDSYLDRTSTCRGRLAKRTLAELKTCRLVVEGTCAATNETVPTLRELLSFTRGKTNLARRVQPHLAKSASPSGWPLGTGKWAF